MVVELDTVPGHFPPAEAVLKRLPVPLVGGMLVGRPAGWSYMERPLRERNRADSQLMVGCNASVATGEPQTSTSMSTICNNLIGQAEARLIFIHS